MNHSPQIAISQWYNQSQLRGGDWKDGAGCVANRHLPWTGTNDKPPNSLEYAQMFAVCAKCPVVRDCASYALGANHGAGVDGGFYAGVWLPWKYRGEGRASRLMRERGRRALKRIVTAQ